MGEGSRALSPCSPLFHGDGLQPLYLHWNNPWNHRRDLVSTVNSCSSLQSRGCRCTKGKGKVNRCPFPSFVHALQPYLDCKRLPAGSVPGAEINHEQ